MARNSIKNITRIVLGVALVLLIPLVAMQFSNAVNWGLADFVIIGGLLIGAGLIYELLARSIKNATHRTILCIVLIVMVLLIWAELAVGVFGTPFAGS